MKLHEYREKPRVKFWGTDDYYLGMELEVLRQNGGLLGRRIKSDCLGANHFTIYYRSVGRLYGGRGADDDL